MAQAITPTAAERIITQLQEIAEETQGSTWTAMVQHRNGIIFVYTMIPHAVGVHNQDRSKRKRPDHRRRGKGGGIH